MPRVSKILYLLAPLAAVFAACGPSDFDPQSQVTSVRILASSADKPYAKPGDNVHLEVLAVDGRTDKSRKMTVFWIPITCENPKNDAYYACFALASGAGDGGAPDASGADGGGGGISGAFALLRPGVDLTPFLKTGPAFDFQMPKDAVTSHIPIEGTDAPYGIAIIFNVACAGHLELVPLNPDTGVQQVPLGCFDEQENPVDSTQYVIGFTRVYAYEDRTNANPVFDHVTFQGNPIDPVKGVDLDHCTTDLRRDCPEVLFDTQVKDESWELNPSDQDPDGNVRHEQIWAAYYSDVGQLESDARLLFDPAQGKVDGSELKYQPPNEIGDGTLWVVVHDNRGGAAWLAVPLHVH